MVKAKETTTTPVPENAPGAVLHDATAKLAGVAQLGSVSRSSGKFKLTVDAAVIKPKRNQYGRPRRNWGRNEWVQLAIQTVCEGDPPRHINITQLTKDVNKWLDSNAEYRATKLGPILRRMVQRVLDEMLRS
jgi:hypothetical protein